MPPTAHSLFEIDAELNDPMEIIQEQVEAEGQASEDLVTRFQEFAEIVERRSTGSAASSE